MKRAIITLIISILIPVFGCAQIIENLEYISPFNDGVSAIKKDGQWAFINREGAIVVPFRNDLVSTKTTDGNYPVFNNNRCIIVKETKGISYFGYIDKTGETVIDPQFLNTTNFNHDKAIALELMKKNVGKNEILGKNIVNYKYFEVTIDTTGVVKDYLIEKGANIALDKKFLKKPPQIKSKLISDHLVAIINENKKWMVKKINE